MIRDSLAGIGLLTVLGVIAVVAIISSKASRSSPKVPRQQTGSSRSVASSVPSGENAIAKPAPGADDAPTPQRADAASTVNRSQSPDAASEPPAVDERSVAPAPLDESCIASVLEKPSEETGLAMANDSRPAPPSLNGSSSPMEPTPPTVKPSRVDLGLLELLLTSQLADERDPQRRTALELEIETVRRERRALSVP